MLIHITPRIYLPVRAAKVITECRLLSLSIDALGVNLRGSDLVTRKPYLNKRYWVGSRHIGRASISGVLLDTTKELGDFTTVARWSINETDVTTHTTHYSVIDNDLQVVSDNVLLWNSFRTGHGYLPDRRPSSEEGGDQRQPLMEYFSPTYHKAIDEIGPDGFITHRTDHLKMPSLELSRFTMPLLSLKLPTEKMALKC